MRRRDFVTHVLPASMLATYVNLPTLVQAQDGASTDGKAWRYIGIPYPTDPVPSAIMPTLPSGADFQNHAWINTYDPILEPTPVPTPGGAPDEWVVNMFNHIPGDVGNGGQGTIARPRSDLPPSGVHSAGTKIFIYGDNTPLPSSESTNRKRDYTGWESKNEVVTFKGTSSNICWIVGIGKPRLGVRNLNITNCTHTIFDGIYLESEPGIKSGHVEVRSSNYFTFRNGGQYGQNTTTGGQAFPIMGTSAFPCKFITYYNNELAYFGDYNLAPGRPKPNDFHGFRPSKYCYWLWCIDNSFHHLSGDACQLNGSNNTNPDYAQRPHYVYFAGNEAYRLKENMFDAKNSYHAIVSQNFSYETEEDAMIMPNNAEGALTGYHWAIANRVTQSGAWGTGGGIRGSGDQANNYTAVIGNLVYDISGTGLQIANQAQGANNVNYWVNNTVVRCNTGFKVNVWQPAQTGWVINLHGNIFYNCTTEINLDAVGNGNINVQISDNILFDPDGAEVIVNRDNIDSESNTIFANPQFANPDGNRPTDFLPHPDGAAQGATFEHNVFSDFERLYGIDIRFDGLGSRRPLDTAWTIGAYELEGIRPNPPRLHT